MKKLIFFLAILLATFSKVEAQCIVKNEFDSFWVESVYQSKSFQLTWVKTESEYLKSTSTLFFTSSQNITNAWYGDQLLQKIITDQNTLFYWPYGVPQQELTIQIKNTLYSIPPEHFNNMLWCLLATPL